MIFYLFFLLLASAWIMKRYKRKPDGVHPIKDRVLIYTDGIAAIKDVTAIDQTNAICQGGGNDN